MRSWPLNMDDELWAAWVWIIHTQGDCRTLLEWLPHICNKGLINTHNSDYDYHQCRHQPTVLFSAHPVDRLGRVSIILCQQKLKLNTAGFLWHCNTATHSQFRFVCMCASTSSWWHLHLYFSSITLHLSLGVIISPPPSDAQWSLSGCIRAVSLRHWTKRISKRQGWVGNYGCNKAQSLWLQQLNLQEESVLMHNNDKICNEGIWLSWECNGAANESKKCSPGQGINSLCILVYNSTHITLPLSKWHCLHSSLGLQDTWVWSCKDHTYTVDAGPLKSALTARLCQSHSSKSRRFLQF